MTSLRAAVLGLLLVSCGSAAGTAPASSPATTTRAAITDPTATSPTTVAMATSTLVPIDMSDPRPLLSISFRGHIRESRLDVDTPNYSLYPDGSVFLATDNGSAAARRFDLRLDERDELLALADRAGLVDGGAQPFLLTPPNVEVMDGGVGIFVRRVGDTFTTRSVDQAGLRGLATDTSAVWDAFNDLALAFVDLSTPLDDGTPMALDRWAIRRTARTEGDELEADIEWTGPDLDTVDWIPIGDGLCAIVEVPNWNYSDEEYRETRVGWNGDFVTRRPLLPHESTCEYVARFSDPVGP